MDDKIGVVFTIRRVWEAKRGEARPVSTLRRWRDTTFPLKKWGMQLLEDLILFRFVHSFDCSLEIAKHCSNSVLSLQTSSTSLSLRRIAQARGHSR
jgi:hypothetical protein